jgi:enamine deaminase RidA (YjgF/YER057c/UK114 family)
MALEIIQPEGLDSPQTYSHVVAATGGRLVFVAGQMSDDPQGNLVLELLVVVEFVHASTMAYGDVDPAEARTGAMRRSGAERGRRGQR